MGSWVAWILKRLGRAGYRVACRLWLNRAHAAQLESILRRHPERTVIVFHPGLEWNMPLFQRPQHMAIHLAKVGALYFYATPNARHDCVYGFKEIGKACYVTNRFDLLSALKDRKRILHLYSSDMSLDEARLQELRQFWENFIYEYIDELHPDLAGKALSASVMRRHVALLADSSVHVVATADRLKADAVRVRGSVERIALVTNGADLEHFGRAEVRVPISVEKFVSEYPVIIGYFGAFASWFDYSLVARLANEHPHYGVLLLGKDFDGTLQSSGVVKLPNVLAPGAVPYGDLPAYAKCFTVGIVPFIVNEITLSTSPIKLFEYMAAGLPVVSTALPECQKYPRVAIATDADSFIAAVNRAVLLARLPETAKVMREAAREYSWESKAIDLMSLLEGVR